MIWTKLKDFVEQVAGSDDGERALDDDELSLATAALLVRASVIDGKIDAVERETVRRLLESRFELSGDEATQLLDLAQAREHEAVDLYGFTSVLARQLDQEGRMRVVEMLWEVAMSDDHVDDFEANLVWRVSELLGVSSRDRVRLRKVVSNRQQGAQARNG